MRFYISGAVTNAQSPETHFSRAESWLKINDHSVVNPVKVIATLPKLSHAECMQVCFKLIDLCDCVYMLKGWQKSAGARAELSYAKAIGKMVKYEDMQKTFKKMGVLSAEI